MELLIKEKEAERMEKYLKEGAYVIAPLQLRENS